MKKSFRISLVALLATVPMMAMAADPVYPATAEPTSDSNAPVASGNPKYALATANSATDGNAASAGYVKGAYNAAIKAINKVHEEAVAAQSTAGNALVKSDIATGSANGTISVKGTDVNVKGLGGAAYKGVAASISSTSTDLATASQVYSAEAAAKSYADGLASNYDAKGAAAAAETAAKSYADGLASNYDAKGAAAAAETAAKSYADGLASNYDAKGAAAAAETAAKSYADGLASNYDAKGAASAAQTAAIAAAKSYADTELAKKINSTAISTAISSASTDAQVASAKAVYDATKNAATKTGVKATVNAAKGSKSGVSLGVNFGTITTNTSALTVSVPTKASYNIMQTWGSDSATAGTYSLGTNSNASVTGTATTSIGATTATGNISDIAISVASYVAE